MISSKIPITYLQALYIYMLQDLELICTMYGSYILFGKRFRYIHMFELRRNLYTRMKDMSWSDKIGMYISGAVSHNTSGYDAHEHRGGQVRTLRAQQ